MFFIWGTKGVAESIEEGHLDCPMCKVITKYELKAIRRWFTFFWIPLIPLGTKGKYLECQNCFTAFNPEFFQKGGIKMG